MATVTARGATATGGTAGVAANVVATLVAGTDSSYQVSATDRASMAGAAVAALRLVRQFSLHRGGVRRDVSYSSRLGWRP